MGVKWAKQWENRVQPQKSKLRFCNGLVYTICRLQFKRWGNEGYIVDGMETLTLFLSDFFKSNYVRGSSLPLLRSSIKNTKKVRSTKFACRWDHKKSTKLCVNIGTIKNSIWWNFNGIGSVFSRLNVISVRKD